MSVVLQSPWLLLGLPFVSLMVISSVNPLSRVATVHHRITWPLGVFGLACLCAALTGLMPAHLASPLAIFGGLAAGFAMLWVPRDDEHGDDWRGGGPPPPDDPPPDPAGDGPLDWELFDRLRAGWSRPRVPTA